MIRLITLLLFILIALPLPAGEAPVQPRVISEPVRHDTDDPAIWIDPNDL